MLFGNMKTDNNPRWADMQWESIIKVSSFHRLIKVTSFPAGFI